MFWMVVIFASVMMPSQWILVSLEARIQPRRRTSRKLCNFSRHPVARPSGRLGSVPDAELARRCDVTFDGVHADPEAAAISDSPPDQHQHLALALAQRPTRLLPRPASGADPPAPHRRCSAARAAARPPPRSEQPVERAMCHAPLPSRPSPDQFRMHKPTRPGCRHIGARQVIVASPNRRSPVQRVPRSAAKPSAASASISLPPRRPPAVRCEARSTNVTSPEAASACSMSSRRSASLPAAQ